MSVLRDLPQEVLAFGILILGLLFLYLPFSKKCPKQSRLAVLSFPFFFIGFGVTALLVEYGFVSDGLFTTLLKYVSIISVMLYFIGLVYKLMYEKKRPDEKVRPKPLKEEFRKKKKFYFVYFVVSVIVLVLLDYLKYLAS